MQLVSVSRHLASMNTLLFILGIYGDAGNVIFCIVEYGLVLIGCGDPAERTTI